MKNLKLLFAVVAIASILSFNSCNNSNKVVKIGYLKIAASLPAFVIQEQQYFEKEGIAYELMPFQTSNQLVDALAADQIDIIVECSAVPVLASENKNPGEIKIFAYSDISLERPFDAIISNHDSIKGIPDLEGKKIGVFPGSTAQHLLDAFLKSKEVNTSGITYIPIAPSNMLDALEHGAIDALHTYEPTTTMALHTGKFHEVFGTVYGHMQSPNPQGVACINNAFYTQNKSLAEKTIEVFNQAYAFMENDESSAKEYLRDYIKLDHEVALKSGLLHFISSKAFDSNYYDKYVVTLKNIGELDQVVKYEDISILK